MSFRNTLRTAAAAFVLAACAVETDKVATTGGDETIGESEEVAVTGSRVARSENDAPSPEPAIDDVLVGLAPPTRPTANPAAPPSASGGAALGMFSARERSAAYAPAQIAPQPAPGDINREEYRDVDSNPIKLVSEEPVSTFSVDVDTASYAVARRFLNQGEAPPSDSVRVEELINYFDYDYPLPESRDAPFAMTTVVTPTPWNEHTQLLHVGLKGYDIEAQDRPRANLVFLLDVSGSMEDPNKLPLLKQSLRMLVEQLDDDDTVSIVVYAGAAGAVLEPTPGSQRGRILAALDNLSAGGSTAGGEGLRLAYSLAEQSFDETAVNRIILATDGDFNVGVTDDERLEDFVARKRESGVYLSILGFGAGNYNDALMQTIAQAGDGTAAYIDSLNEARKVLHDEMAGTLFPIADDVKIQIEFNPARVAEYRLIGYETRLLRREDFSNDAVDAGEIGAGHEVTAVYEIAAPGSEGLRVEPSRYSAVPEAQGEVNGEFAFLRVRYKLPGEDESRLIEQPITEDDAFESIAKAPAETRWVAAVAAYGQLLRRDPYTGAFDFSDVIDLAQGARGEDPFGYRAEFVQLARLADSAAALNPLERDVAGVTQ
jgi:Ca-activated chloride channel family protein